ncbi:MAG TPA: Sir2 family NAD-dependent protein deacetylase [Bacteroidota bacterium]|nr:Sir2 family NAD-dependent protein deacetylase [Bacteroidota bacterium]
MKTVVVFSGAGLSAESGIPTFRDSGGLWDQHRIEDVASPEGWERNKHLVLNFYEQRFLRGMECKPNPAHEAIARLASRYDVVNITQNIDTLLERAGSKNVWHLHGRIDHQKCERHYSIPAYSDSSYSCDYRAQISSPTKLGDTCPKCGSQLRPDVVWFGEAVDMRQDYLETLTRKAEIFIGVGTSAQVYPAAGLLPLFRRTRERFFIDPHPAYDMLDGFVILKGTASGQLPGLAEELLSAASAADQDPS